jgi:hypothetical protein
VVLINTSKEPYLARALADDNCLGEQGFRVEANSPLNVIGRGDLANLVRGILFSDEVKLVGAQLTQRRRAMRGHEGLERRLLFFCTDRAEQPNQPVRFKTVLQLVTQDDGGVLRGPTLKPGDQESGRAYA